MFKCLRSTLHVVPRTTVEDSSITAKSYIIRQCSHVP